jgi:hypothetical protein
MTPPAPTPSLENDWSFRLSFGAFMAAVAFLAIMLAPQFTLVLDTDTHWHIATGQWIVENGRVPWTDMFSHTFNGEIWLAKEWLSQVILYYVHSWFGWTGINILAVGLVTLAFGMISVVCQRSLRFTIALAIPLAVLVFASPHYAARPHLLSYPVMILWFMGVVWAADARRVPSYWLLPVMTLWANLHGGFTLGMVIAGFMSLETIFSLPRAHWPRAVMRHGVFLALTLVAALITPYGYHSILITQKIFDMSSVLANVNEWTTPDFHKYRFQLLTLVCLLGLSLYGGLRLKLWRIAAVLAIFYLMLMHTRALAIFSYTLPILVAFPAALQFPAISAASHASAKGRDPIRSLLAARTTWLQVLSVCLVAGGVLAGTKVQHFEARTQDEVPTEEVAFAKSNGLTGNVLNDYNYGGYLILEGIPTYIDSRAELFGGKFFSEARRALISAAPKTLRKVLEEHDIEWTLVGRYTSGAALLDSFEDWRCIYAGRHAKVHVKASHPNLESLQQAAGNKGCEPADQ